MNIDVDSDGEPVKVDDNWWAYNKPLDKVEMEDLEHPLNSEELEAVAQDLANWWNLKNREFKHDETWKPWSDRGNTHVNDRN